MRIENRRLIKSIVFAATMILTIAFIATIPLIIKQDKKSSCDSSDYSETNDSKQLNEEILNDSYTGSTETENKNMNSTDESHNMKDQPFITEKCSITPENTTNIQFDEYKKSTENQHIKTNEPYTPPDSLISKTKSYNERQNKSSLKESSSVNTNINHINSQNNKDIDRKNTTETNQFKTNESSYPIINSSNTKNTSNNHRYDNTSLNTSKPPRIPRNIPATQRTAPNNRKSNVSKPSISYNRANTFDKNSKTSRNNSQDRTTTNKNIIGLPNPKNRVCYFNASIQCLVSSKYFTDYFNQNGNSALFKDMKEFINNLNSKSPINLSETEALLKLVAINESDNSPKYTGEMGSNSIQFIEDLINSLSSKELNIQKRIVDIFQVLLEKKDVNGTISSDKVYSYEVFDIEMIKNIINMKSYGHDNDDDYIYDLSFNYNIKFNLSDIFIVDFQPLPNTENEMTEIVKTNTSFISNGNKYSLFGITLMLGLYTTDPDATRHYVSYAKRNGKWYYFDDDKVNKMTGSKFSFKNASSIYLFFEKNQSD
ncbi:hypothetical protein TCON_2539 [Astathelohania contejeani]|uniref:USP domain-containing protein n=1 Tax=Astathelohania contejeani TaxID=164912 RepID=A0ABQ7HVQ2_9MICR|nr:hypothetical protein TCON_2539 [Thelohania contejeani]